MKLSSISKLLNWFRREEEVPKDEFSLSDFMLGVTLSEPSHDSKSHKFGVWYAGECFDILINKGKSFAGDSIFVLKHLDKENVFIDPNVSMSNDLKVKLMAKADEFESLSIDFDTDKEVEGYIDYNTCELTIDALRYVFDGASDHVTHN